MQAGRTSRWRMVVGSFGSSRAGYRTRVPALRDHKVAGMLGVGALVAGIPNHLDSTWEAPSHAADAVLILCETLVLRGGVVDVVPNHASWFSSRWYHLVVTIHECCGLCPRCPPRLATCMAQHPPSPPTLPPSDNLLHTLLRWTIIPGTHLNSPSLPLIHLHLFALSFSAVSQCLHLSRMVRPRMVCNS